MAVMRFEREKWSAAQLPAQSVAQPCGAGSGIPEEFGVVVDNRPGMQLIMLEDRRGSDDSCLHQLAEILQKAIALRLRQVGIGIEFRRIDLSVADVAWRTQSIPSAVGDASAESLLLDVMRLIFEHPGALKIAAQYFSESPLLRRMVGQSDHDWAIGLDNPEEARLFIEKLHATQNSDMAHSVRNFYNEQKRQQQIAASAMTVNVNTLNGSIEGDYNQKQIFLKNQ